MSSLIPSMNISFDNSFAGGSSSSWKTLIIGEKKGGRCEANKKIAITSLGRAAEEFDLKSDLYAMIEMYFHNNQNAEVYAIALEPEKQINGPDGVKKGSGKVDVSKVFEVIKDERFNAFLTTYNDKENLKIFNDELKSRWNLDERNDGVLFVATNDNYDACKDIPKFINSQNIIFLNTDGYKQAPHIVLAAFAAAVCDSANTDPAVPLSFIDLQGITASENELSSKEREQLLSAGFSTLKTSGISVMTERVVTTYKTNATGSPDESYLNAESVFTLSKIRDYFRTKFWSKFYRHKLADDGAVLPQGQKILTPKVAKAELISIYKDLEELGIVHNSSLFISNLSVYRDKENRSKIHMVLPPTIMGQLFNVDATIQFRR